MSWLLNNINEDFSQKSGMKSDSSDAHDRVSHIFNFLIALEDTYCANWRTFDYISPNCFLYLVDHLVIMVSHFQGLIFTTRSSFLEWYVYQQSVANSRTDSVVVTQFSFERVFDSVINMVHQLLTNKEDTSAWILRSNINVNYYYPLLVLKLFVIHSLLCLNSREYFDSLFILLGRGDITCRLPREFYNSLCRSRGRNNLNLTPNILAEAFKRIEDPLVIASFRKPSPKVVALDGIFVDIEYPMSKEDIIRVLFPDTKPLLHNSAAAEVDPTSNDDAERNSVGPFSNNASTSDQNVHAKNENEMLHMSWGVFQEISDSVKPSGNKKKRKVSLPNATKIKVGLEKNIHVLTAATTKSFEKKLDDNEEGSTFCEAKSMIDELKQLSSALTMSEINLGNISSILETLQSRRPKVENFLKNQSLMQAVDSKGKNEEKASVSSLVAVEAESNEEEGDGVAEETINSADEGKGKTTAASSETQSTGNKGKGKFKKNKKGKGSRRR